MQTWKRGTGAALAAIWLALGATAEERGAVTDLPLPRFVSMKAEEGNVRRGPSLAHRIDWVFTRRDLPLRVTAEHGHWRRVEDADGQGGWMHYALLSGVRTAQVQAPMLALRSRPDPQARTRARLERGVIARLRRCTGGWCVLEVEGHDGWVPADTLWGVAAGESFD